MFPYFRFGILRISFVNSNDHSDSNPRELGIISHYHTFPVCSVYYTGNIRLGGFQPYASSCLSVSEIFDVQRPILQNSTCNFGWLRFLPVLMLDLLSDRNRFSLFEFPKFLEARVNHKIRTPCDNRLRLTDSNTAIILISHIRD